MHSNKIVKVDGELRVYRREHRTGTGERRSEGDCSNASHGEMGLAKAGYTPHILPTRNRESVNSL